MKIRAGIWLAAVAVFFSGSAWSHIQRFSSSELRLEETSAVWTLKVHLTDFDQMFHGASESDVRGFLPKRLGLQAGAVPCRLENSLLEKDISREVVTIRLNYACDSSGAALKVDYGLFFGDPSHRHLLKYFSRGKTQNFTFMAALTEKEFQTPSAWSEFKSFLRLGFDHILSGFDHILFILSLVFGAKHFKKLFWLVTSFTLAHSLSLALAVTGVFALPSRIVEPAIAASIAFIAIRHALAKEDQDFKSDLFITFGFGLIHGLGFSGALREADLSAGNLALPLLAFNLGVEFGQVLIVGAVFPLLQFLEKILKGAYLWVKRAALLAMAGMGLFWMIERL